MRMGNRKKSPMLVKVVSARAPRGKVKFRIRKYRSGISGSGVRRSWATKATDPRTQSAAMARVAGAVQPQVGAWLRPKRPVTTANESNPDPAQSSRHSDGRGAGGPGGPGGPEGAARPAPTEVGSSG